MNLINVGYV